MDVVKEEDLLEGGLYRLEEGAKHFQQAILALQRHDRSEYENNLKLSAHIGVSSLELLMKSYLLQSSCHSKMTDDEQQSLQKPNITILFNLMTKYGEPSLEPSFRQRLSRYNREIYNATKHWNEVPDFPETPLGYGLRESLNGITDFVLRYFPQEKLDQNLIERVQEYLSTTIGKRSLDEKTIRNQFGEFFRLVQPTNYRPASDIEIQRYYQGIPLNWNIVLANGDVERDIQNELITTYATPIQQTRILCITGGPGAGKSTLAWRIAYEISSITNFPLLQVHNSIDLRFWSSLEMGSIDYVDPIIVLVDDIFSNPDTVRILENFNPNLNVTIISTTQSIEMPDILQLPFVQSIKIGMPSPEEKTRVINRIFSNIQESNVKYSKTIETANSWWVMMMQATKGEALSTIVQKMVARLKRNDIDVYSAYEYICYFGQFDLAVPISILEKLDSKFYNLGGRRASEDIIFSQTDSSVYRTINSVFAREALKAYFDHNPTRVIDKILSVIDVENELHQTLLSLWIMKKIVTDPKKTREFCFKNSLFLNEILEQSGMLGLNIWIKIYSKIDPNKTRDLAKKIIHMQPNTSQEWLLYILIVKKFGGYQDWVALYPKIEPWLSSNDDSIVRRAFNYFILEKGTIEQKKDLTSKTKQWLLSHTDDSIVRSSYLNLIKEVDAEDQKEIILRETRQWLSQHPRDVETRIIFLKFVKNHKDRQFVMDVFNETSDWLDDPNNQENVTVRLAYMDLVTSLNNPELMLNLINMLQDWLLMSNVNHDDVRAKLLSLLNFTSDSKQKHKIIDDTLNWLPSHEEAIQVRTSLLKLAGSMRDDQRSTIASSMRQWLADHPLDHTVRQAYLRFLVEFGSPTDRQINIDATKDWFRGDHSTGNVWETFLKLVTIGGTPEQIQQTLDDALIWIDSHSEDKVVLQCLMAHLEKFGSQDQIDAYLTQTKLWLESHPNETHVRSEFLGFVEKFGTKEDFDSLMNDMENRLNIFLEDEHALRSFLWILIKKPNTPKEILERAYLLGNKWITTHPKSKNYLLLGCYARILYHLAKYSEAIPVFRRIIRLRNDYDAPTHILLAWCLFYLGNHKSALLELKRTRDFAEQYPETFPPSSAYHQLGRYYEELQDNREAEKFFRLEIKVAPKSMGGYWELGRIFLQYQWLTMALQAFEYADKLVMEDLNPEARQELDDLIQQTKSKISAREARKRNA